MSTPYGGSDDAQIPGESTRSSAGSDPVANEPVPEFAGPNVFGQSPNSGSGSGRSHRSWLIVTAAIVAILILIAITVGYFGDLTGNSDLEDAEEAIQSLRSVETIEEFNDSLCSENQAPGEAVDLLEKTSETTGVDFNEGFRNQAEAAFPPDVHVTDLTEASDAPPRTRATFTATFAGEEITSEVLLAEQDQEWKICDPQLDLSTILGDTAGR